MRSKVFALILMIFAAFQSVSSECRSDSAEAPFRFTYPARITDYSGQKIFFSISLKNTVFVSEMAVDEKTEFPPLFEKNYKTGLWYIFYCADTPGTVAWLQKTGVNRVKMETKADQEKRLAKSSEKKQ